MKKVITKCKAAVGYLSSIWQCAAADFAVKLKIMADGIKVRYFIKSKITFFNKVFYGSKLHQRYKWRNHRG